MNFISELFGGKRLDRRRRYIVEQICQIAPRFSKNGGKGVNFDEQNCDWVHIPQYALPERWAQRWTSLLIIFPANYPDCPPLGFYLSHDLGLKSGGRDPHLLQKGYHGAETFEGWHWYCVLAQVRGVGGWHPGADPTESDNLWTFLNLVREALTSDE